MSVVKYRKIRLILSRRIFQVGSCCFGFLSFGFSYLVVTMACEKPLSPMFFLFLSTFFIQVLTLSYTALKLLSIRLWLENLCITLPCINTLRTHS
jgi:hypothetical protein